MFATENLTRNLRTGAIVAAMFLPASLTLGSGQAKKAYFGENTTPNVIALLPMPPDAGTQEEQADRAASLAIYSGRTPEQFALGKAQNKLSIFHFSTSMGPWFQKGKFPKAEALFAQLDREVRAFTNSAQKYFQRPRPAQIDSAHFSELIGKDESGSYPSGHSTYGTLYALLLIELFPQQRGALHAQGREIGWLRVQGGMDTPLDVYAGRVLGRALAQALMRNPEFLVDFEEVREELAAAMPAPTAPVAVLAK